jgi:hypothetical protein
MINIENEDSKKNLALDFDLWQTLRDIELPTAALCL